MADQITQQLTQVLDLVKKEVLLIDVTKQSFRLAVASIAFNPTFWNIVARQEYHNRILTNLFKGNSRYGCYLLAVTIFLLGLFRDFLYERAIRDQPTSVLLSHDFVKYAGAASFAIGNVLVLSSMWALGFTGTYLGDYFGILMDEKVTGFPFNVTDAPMYYGSTLSFLGTALWFGSPAGVALTGFVLVVYLIALTYEDPFTGAIYAKREEERKKKST